MGSVDVSALQLASHNGHNNTVQLLLDSGANPNAKGGVYKTALGAASARGHTQIVRLLLKRGAEVNAQSVHQALKNRQYETARLLLDKGNDSRNMGKSLGTGLPDISASGDIYAVQLLIMNGVDVNMKTDFYGTALQAASINGHTQIVQLLLENDADVKATGGKYGTALIAASANGHQQIVQLLLGGDARVKEHEGFSSIARRTGYFQPPPPKDYFGFALEAALHAGHYGIVKLLVENGVTGSF
jgi:ankyrin repeat protein